MNTPTFKANLDKIVATLLMILMALMVCNVTWQVFSRYILQNPSSFTDELSRYMLVWLGMLGAAYVAGRNEHLAIDILPQRMSGRPKLRLEIFIFSIVASFALLAMVLGGSNLVYITLKLEQKSATLQIPLGYIYSIIPVSGILVIYYQFFQIKQALKLYRL